MKRLAALVACSVLLLACASHEVIDPTGPIIDGWRIGPEVSGDHVTAYQVLIEAATAALDKREPRHPAIASVAIHELRQDLGHIAWRTTGNTAAVFVLSDGSRRAVFVGSAFGTPVTQDYGPG